VAIVVRKLPFESVTDVSGLVACFEDGIFGADDVVAAVGKTEGNGGVNDFSRILADRVLRDCLVEHGSRSLEEARRLPLVWSGGCDGVIAPHMTVFAEVGDDRNGSAADAPEDGRLAIGVALSDPILPEEIGRIPMVEKVAEGVRKAMKNAGIDDPADVHYVQTKTPLLTIERIAAARSRGRDVVTEETMDSMAISNATAALGIGVALDEFPLPREEQIARDRDLYSSVASCSSGVELDEAQIVLVGNRRGALGDFRIGHGVMRDNLDIGGIYDAIRSAGLALPDRPTAEDLGGAVVNCFIKCEADPSGRLRGRRLVALNDSDIHHTHHTKATVGAIAALAIGDSAVFCSVAALQQGPSGGGSVAAIVDTTKLPR
jgi:cyanuric acid amidohydrolase